jgi:hypothetical protein
MLLGSGKFILNFKTVETLFWKFLKIKMKFFDFPDSTHLDLLKEIEPYLSTFYEKLLNLETLSLNRFQIGFGKFYGVEFEMKIAKRSEYLQTVQSGYHP